MICPLSRAVTRETSRLEKKRIHPFGECISQNFMLLKLTNLNELGSDSKIQTKILQQNSVLQLGPTFVQCFGKSFTDAMILWRKNNPKHALLTNNALLLSFLTHEISMPILLSWRSVSMVQQLSKRSKPTENHHDSRAVQQFHPNRVPESTEAIVGLSGLTAPSSLSNFLGIKSTKTADRGANRRVSEKYLWGRREPSLNL